MSKKSDGYEQFIQRLMQERFGESTKVDWHKTFTGIRSRREIVVDVSFTFRIPNGIDVLVVVECKCYSHRVSVDDVEEFITKLNDIGAHKGVMVTTVGYQEGTVNTAKGYGVALALITKTRQKGELTYVLNSAGGEKPETDTDEFWQGNLQGPYDTYDCGFRFDSMPEFVGLLYKEQWTEWARRNAPTQPVPAEDD